MTRRRVVLFTPGLTEPGGAARRSATLVSGLARRGWEVRVITRAGTLRRFLLRREEQMIVLEIPGFGLTRLGALLFLLLAVPWGLIMGRRTKALLSIQLTSQTTAGALCASILRKPLVSFLTTGGDISETTYIRSAPTFRLRRWFLGRASVLVAQTEHARADLAHLVPGTRVEVVPNPVRGMTVTPLNGRPRILFAGRFSEEKDLGRLLEAWLPIASSDRDAALVLLGAGGGYRSVEAELRNKIASDETLERSVELPGWVLDVDPYLAENDVFVFPSRSEGMSNSLLEACAAGRVVVASDIPSNLAVVGDDHPLTFTTGSRDDLERALRAALYDPEVRTAAVRNVIQRITRFTEEAFIDRVEELIYQCE